MSIIDEKLSITFEEGTFHGQTLTLEKGVLTLDKTVLDDQDEFRELEKIVNKIHKRNPTRATTAILNALK